MPNTTDTPAPEASFSSTGLAGGSLHDRITNLPCRVPHFLDVTDYRAGHRAARDAAAELAAAADARTLELLDMIRSIAGYASSVRVDRLDDSREYALQTVDWCNGLLEWVEQADALVAKATTDEPANSQVLPPASPASP